MRRIEATRAAASCPDTTADSIVAGRPVSIQSPARKNPSSAVSVARPGWRVGGEREGGAPFANRRGPPQGRGSRGRHGLAQLGERAVDECVVRLGGQRRRAARDQRQMGRAVARRSRPCRTPIETRRPGRPTSSRSTIGRSNQRLTVTIAELSRSAACCIVSASCAGGSSKIDARREPRHGRDHDRHVDLLVSNPHAGDAVAGDADVRRRIDAARHLGEPRATRAPDWRRDRRAAPPAEHDGGGARIGAEHLLQDADEMPARRRDRSTGSARQERAAPRAVRTTSAPDRDERATRRTVSVGAGLSIARSQRVANPEHRGSLGP